MDELAKIYSENAEKIKSISPEIRNEQGNTPTAVTPVAGAPEIPVASAPINPIVPGKKGKGRGRGATEADLLNGKIISARDLEFEIPSNVLETVQTRNPQTGNLVNQVQQEMSELEQNLDLYSANDNRRLQQLLEKEREARSKIKKWINLQLKVESQLTKLEQDIRRRYEKNGDTFAKNLNDFTRLCVADVIEVKDQNIDKAGAGDFANKDEAGTTGATTLQDMQTGQVSGSENDAEVIPQSRQVEVSLPGVKKRPPVIPNPE